ncbi:MAG: hypothetical protein GY804_00825 [Alphaproteobacteria bacterium]|nr:hypothetical protein [Alphaproteobacteria bacterium]
MDVLNKKILSDDCAEVFYYEDADEVPWEKAFPTTSLPEKDQERLNRIAETLICLRANGINVKLDIKSYSPKTDHAKERLKEIKKMFLEKGLNDKFFGKTTNEKTSSVSDESETSSLQKNKLKSFWVKLMPKFW